MTQRKPGRDAALLKREQRVARKDNTEFGTVTEANGRVKVKWDGGQTSYFRRDERANVKEKLKR